MDKVNGMQKMWGNVNRKMETKNLKVLEIFKKHSNKVRLPLINSWMD